MMKCNIRSTSIKKIVEMIGIQLNHHWKYFHYPREGIILIDCLTLWLSNNLLANKDINTESFINACHDANHVVCVSNETGLGVVPDNYLARKFRTAQGQLNQKVAAQSDLVVQVIAGIPLVLKGKLPEDFS